MTGTRESAMAWAQARFDAGDYLAELRRLVAVPTESQIAGSLPALMRYCAETLPALMQGMGFEPRVLPNPVAGRGPVFVATRIEDPGLPTVLVYGHGDVVRGLAGAWSDGMDPWAVSVRGEKWYGRGTVDNKGQHLIAIEALRAVIAERGSLGFNAKVLVETGEEQGSPGLRALLQAERDALAADVFVGLDGPRQTTFMPEIKLGARGGVAFDLVVRLRDHAHHSGHWGGVLKDPGFVLAHAMACIVDRHGRIRVPGWVPDAMPPSVRRAIGDLVFEAIPGLPQADPDWGEPGLTTGEKVFGWTSVIVLAALTGHPDAPTNAVQGEARARLQVRHTADIRGDAVVPALRRHLDAEGFAEVQIIPIVERDMFGASRTDPDDPWVAMVADSMARSSNRRPNIVPNSSGSNPSDMFQEELGVPVIWVPNSYAGCNQHGPDEHALAPLLREGLGLMAGLWWDIGAGFAPPRRGARA
jgi:acetylornithine deacetylase/succinyl-diaminopimelate desuccinylase-like protein